MVSANNATEPLMITTRLCKAAVMINPSRLILTARMPATLGLESLVDRVMRVVDMRHEQRIQQAPDSCWMLLVVLLALTMNLIIFTAPMIMISCILALIVSVLGRHGHSSPARCRWWRG
jgi:hypothetical protein